MGAYDDMVCGVCGSDVVLAPAPSRRSTRPGRITAAPSGDLVPDHCSNAQCIRYRAQTFGWFVKRDEYTGDSKEL